MYLIGYPGKAVLEERPDDAVIDRDVVTSQWPGAVIVQFSGGYGDLERFGKTPSQGDLQMSGGIDPRPYAMPAITSDVLSGAIKTECSRRIYDKVSAEEQMNMAMALPDASADDAKTIRAVRAWVDEMRTASKTLISAVDAFYAEDSKWPVWTASWSSFVAQF